MKICLISNLYPPHDRGGAEKIVYSTARELIEAGHEVLAITACPWRGPKSLKPILKIENKIKVYRFYPLNIFFYSNDYKKNVLVRFFWHFFDLFNFHSAFVVKKILRKEKPDVVHTHNLNGLGFLIPHVIRSSGRWVQTLHGVVFANPSGIINRDERHLKYKMSPAKLYAKIARWLFGSPHLVLSPSKFLLDFYSNEGFFKKSKKVLLPNFALREKVNFNLSDGPLKFLYLGQIEKHKGIIFLLNVFKELKADCELHIVGGGSKLNEIKKLGARDPRIIIHGPVPHEEVQIFLGEADFLIVPSLCYENSPTAIYEAFNFSVPVVGSDIGGIPELIKDGQNGFLFKAGGEESLSFRFYHILKHREDIKKMRENAFKSGQEFSKTRHIKRLIEFYMTA